ncbi:MAG: hypothetical protein ACRENP_04360 [Longimicrobiales bacterium]
MRGSVEGEARKAIVRLRRAVEKVEHELDSVEGALRSVEGSDFPADGFADMQSKVADIAAFIGEQAERLEEKMLHAGGLEPGRIRRSSS